MPLLIWPAARLQAQAPMTSPQPAEVIPAPFEPIESTRQPQRDATTAPDAARQATTRRARRRLPKGFVAKTVTMPDGSKRKYALFIPPLYDADKTHRWPVILSLHGSGECGKDGIKQTTVGLAPQIVSRTQRFPFIAIFPQAHSLWFHGPDGAANWVILNDILDEYRTDPDRVYLTGLSMGGFATWEMAVAQPDAFAAIVPICGAGPKDYMSNIRHLPVWAFHGALDKNVPVARSRELVAELKHLGARPKYTEYPTVPHNAWDRAYATPDLWRWLLKQRRQPPPRVIDYRLPWPKARIWWLAVEADESAGATAHIRAQLRDTQVIIQSTNVAGWVLSEGPAPLEPGAEIEVIWNDRVVFQGRFSGQLSVTPRSTPEKGDITDLSHSLAPSPSPVAFWAGQGL
ncbi:MAG: dienelactone hydrolase family protein [Planctomycetes bacterium]|nr:dienelactone hydrolase family protein [Planctomycetota bacterium]